MDDFLQQNVIEVRKILYTFFRHIFFCFSKLWSNTERITIIRTNTKKNYKFCCFFFDVHISNKNHGRYTNFTPVGYGLVITATTYTTLGVWFLVSTMTPRVFDWCWYAPPSGHSYHNSMFVCELRNLYVLVYYVFTRECVIVYVR